MCSWLLILDSVFFFFIFLITDVSGCPCASGVIEDCDGVCGGPGANDGCGCDDEDYYGECCPIANIIDCLCADDNEVSISVCSGGPNPCPLNFDEDEICNPWDDCD